MKKANVQGTPSVAFSLDISPDELRTAANRLEAAAEVALPGHTIRLDIAPGLALVWEPELAMQRSVKQLLGSDRQELAQ
jgi:hypothetical protein